MPSKTSTSPKSKRSNKSKNSKDPFQTYESETTPLFTTGGSSPSSPSNSPRAVISSQSIRGGAYRSVTDEEDGLNSGGMDEGSRGRSCWRLHLVLLLFMNLLLFACGAGGLGLLLYFHEVMLTLWLWMFCVAIAFCIMLVIYALCGISAVCWGKAVPIVLYAVLAVLVVVCVCGVETLYFIAWSDMKNDNTRNSLTSSFGGVWAKDVNDAGSHQADVCSIQQTLHCAGWHAGCWTLQSEERSQGTLYEQQAILLKISLSLLDDDNSGSGGNGSTTNNTTQGGNCPLCFGDSVYSPSATTCGDAVYEKLNVAVWYVLGGGCAIALMVLTGVIWASRVRRDRADEQRSQELLVAQRFL